MATPKTPPSASAEIDRWLAALPEAPRAALQTLRQTIKSAAPNAVEVFSYSIPAFRLDGRVLVSYVAAKNHCSFFVMSPAVMDAHKDVLKSYDTSKGTIRFTPDKPLPATLVRKLVKARIAENAAANAAAAAKKGR